MTRSRTPLRCFLPVAAVVLIAPTAALASSPEATEIGEQRGFGQQAPVTKTKDGTTVTVSPRGTVVVLNEVPGAVMVSIKGVDNATMEFPTFHPALSPDGRFVVFERHQPRHADEPTVLALVDIEQPGDEPAKAVGFFPGDQNEHVLNSELQWVDARTFAFIDVGLTAETSWIVAAEVGEEGGIVRLARRELDPAILIDPANMDSDRLPPAFGVGWAKISRLEDAGLFLRLLFPTSPLFKVRRLDIKVW